jgi:hypothetical protein
MVYNHPRAYFLGGENRWQLTWYDLEQDTWGVCQVRLEAIPLVSVCEVRHGAEPTSLTLMRKIKHCELSKLWLEVKKKF